MSIGRIRVKTFFLVSVVAILPAFSGCLKKGDNDPNISLRTRMARLTGKWKLVEYSSRFSNTCFSQGGPAYSFSYSFDGSIMKESFSGCCCMCSPVVWDTSYVNAYQYSEFLTIYKDGTYSQEVNTGGVISSGGDKWEWGNSDKTKINFYKQYTNFYSYSPRTIDRLSNEEMVLIDGGDKSVYEKQ